MSTAIMEAPMEPAPLDYARVTPAAPVSIPKIRPSRGHLWILLLITLLGGLLRFSYPTKPLLWGDDAYTVYRTHADYQSMLDILQYDGFTPLHYELYWLLGRAAGTETSSMTRDANGEPGPPVVHSTGMRPGVLRLLPAFFGTLMVPAMYLLAVQLVRRKTALVIALVTACSAYLLGYSRDMKMYMMVWCFSALSAGCLLWWFRANTRLSWLAWVAASLAMASSHMTGMALLPFEAIFFLTRSNVHWKQSILFIFGLAIIIIPPAGYITQFNTWAQDNVEDFGFEVEGLGWIGPYNAGRTGPQLARYVGSAYLFSWEWPKPVTPGERLSADPSTDRTVPPWILTTLKSTATLFLILAAFGAMPWSRRLRGLDPETITALLPHERAPQPWWRVFLWVGLWLVLPIYFMYCRSVPDFAGPKDWWTDFSNMLAGNAWLTKEGTTNPYFWLFLGIAATIAAVCTWVFPRFRRALVWLVPAAAGLLLMVSLLRSGVPKTMPKGIEWIPALGRPFFEWADMLSEPFVLTCLVILLPGLLIFYSGPTWSRRIGRLVQFVLVSAVLVASCWLVYTLIQQKFEKELAQAAEKAHDPQFIRRYGTPRAYVTKVVWASIFMPRYVGFAWIAFCIALCTLLMRLPTRPLRFVAILLLVAVNLSQFSGRLFAGTEPPLDRVAVDSWSVDSHNEHPDVTTRVYINDTPVGGSGHPGWGTMVGQQGKYYLGLARGYWIHPTEWKSARGSEYFDIGSRIAPGGGNPRAAPRGRSAFPDPATIALDARRSPQVKRIIVWDKFFDETVEHKDRLETLLGSSWKVASEQDYNVRFHWNWSDLYVYRRTEYVRK
jgi:4-amino-4-deoxy-L-arabinose transferase-like glycosyltransferase